MLLPISTAVSVGPPNTTGAPMLLAVVIALPVALFFLLALTLVILVVACCLFARKRKHSMYTSKFEGHFDPFIMHQSDIYFEGGSATTYM